MNGLDHPAQVNTATTISGSSSPGTNIYITNALASFTANGQSVPITGGQVLNFASPFLVTGDVTSATAGTIFYYYY